MPQLPPASTAGPSNSKSGGRQLLAQHDALTAAAPKVPSFVVAQPRKEARLADKSFIDQLAQDPFGAHAAPAARFRYRGYGGCGTEVMFRLVLMFAEKAPRALGVGAAAIAAGGGGASTCVRAPSSKAAPKSAPSKATAATMQGGMAAGEARASTAAVAEGSDAVQSVGGTAVEAEAQAVLGKKRTILQRSPAAHEAAALAGSSRTTTRSGRESRPRRNLEDDYIMLQ